MQKVKQNGIVKRIIIHSAYSIKDVTSSLMQVYMHIVVIRSEMYMSKQLGTILSLYLKTTLIKC